jgi:hypothetical protein
VNTDTQPHTALDMQLVQAAMSLNTKAERWELGGSASVGKDRSNHHALKETLQKAVSHSPWTWPKREIIFIADPHADCDAFVASLLASGGVELNSQHQLQLTERGRKAQFIIGGDCLDKGPSNLQLLRQLKALMDTGARVKLLAGNHDVRLLVGLRSLQEERDPRTEHLFARMSPKVLPLLKEVFEHYLANQKNPLKGIPRERDCRRMLLPSSNWFKTFPEEAAWLMTDEALERELVRMRKKVDGFESSCAEYGLSMREIYATAKLLQTLFLEPDGEFAWFFDKMQLLHQSGSFLFIHAGLDDRVISTMEEKGVRALNRLYKQQLHSNLFEFYYGAVANTMRTKYRPVDMPLHHHAVECAYQLGIHAVVHGHRNRTKGQRLMLRRGMLHIEGDITLDRHSRTKEGLTGIGIGATIISPKGQVLGISNDYPKTKVFEPAEYF